MLLATPVIVFLVTVLMMLALRPFAEEFELVDAPGGHKWHVGEIPIIGGIAMFVGTAVGIALLPDVVIFASLLLVASGLLVLVGAIDDRFELPASVRFLAQLATVCIMVFGAGLIMRDIGNPLWIGRISLGPFSLIITILIFASVINAFNMADGLDGLAGSMSVIALVAIAFVAPSGSGTQTLALILLAAVLGFLVFNLPYGSKRPFRAFMGDAGSTFLGFGIVWLMVGICQGPERMISPVHGLWFAALPIFDLFTCFTLRVARRTSPFTSGRDHLHHVLLDRGVSVPKTLVTLVFLQSGYAVVGIVSLYAGTPEPVVFSIWALTGIVQRKIVQGIGSLYALRIPIRESGPN